MQCKLSSAIKWGVLTPFALFVLLWIVGILLCQIPSKRVHVRGELDRRSWVVRDYESGDSYRVIMTSGQVHFFYKQEKQLQATNDEKLIIEFEGEINPIKMPWEKLEVVGVLGMFQLERLPITKTTAER
ncbi:MAG: hypothetical protein HZC54_23695 [Verrucomicrobia bacterium]|nr:hypothetical protein [Verrucomicrobiota bacterium]